jgi:hypothetical protein
MSLIGDLVDGVLEGTGWAAGVAIVLGVAAISSRRSSPLVKEVMKGYLTVSDRVKELVAEAGEQLQDLYAEAKSEYETGASPLATVGGAGGVRVAAAAAPGARRRGRPRAAEAAPTAAEGSTTARRRGRPPRAEGAAGNSATAAPAARRGRRPSSGASAESNAA